MSPGPRQDHSVWRWTSRAAVDALVASITLLVGVAMMVDSYGIGAGWADGSLQPGYFPFRLGAIICILSVAIAWHALKREARANEAFAERRQVRLVMSVLVPTLLYVAVIGWLGIYLASALFIGAFMRLGQKRGWIGTAAVSVGVMLALFILFEIVFLVPLPKGPIEALIGY
jgi:putative tricarboxylic transport membrane protein